jgi:D-3-phosphoglycerate dehydrogenase
MKQPPHIIVADWLAGDFSIEETRLRELGWTWTMPPWSPPSPPLAEQEADILARIASAETVTGVLFLLAPLTTRVIDALPTSCRHLQRVGIGLDNVDLDRARARGITVGNTPDYATEEVAVQATATILSLHRQLGETQKALAAGRWQVRPPEPIERLSTLTLGLVGLGRIGRKLAEFMRPLVKEVIFHDPAVTVAPEGLSAATFDEVLRRADIVSLHCPLLPSTRNLINRETLGRMKTGALLINVSRGALVDAQALQEAIADKRLGGAGLDVFEPEVLPKESPLHGLSNVVLTSHTAWYSRQSVMDSRIQAIDRLIEAVKRSGAGV